MTNSIGIEDHKKGGINNMRQYPDGLVNSIQEIRKFLALPTAVFVSYFLSLGKLL